MQVRRMKLFICLVFFLGVLLLAVCSKSRISKPIAEEPASYVGAQQCLTCHQEQYKLWQGSHHDLAMQPANQQTVLGNFSNATFEYNGILSMFYKKGERFFVKTDGADGQLAEYEITYTFGVDPLQQYLIKFENGRFQVLSIAWDSRSAEKGGQRWFHLYPEENIKYDDELHWTGINQNWNFMCADCHSTNLQKNYDYASKSYDTKWSEINVSCEACHGPASNHIAWAGLEDKAKDKNDAYKNSGFIVVHNERKNRPFLIDPKTGSANPHKTETNTEIEGCAQCHSRRASIRAGARPEHKLLDNNRLSLLTEPLYHPDGQIDDEVYVYGSYVQSKMYKAGVTCSSCHEPHSLKLRAKGNNLCAQCHQADKFDTVEHLMHKPGTEAANCVSCHMPDKKYMIIDPRRDHSIRNPRPDLTVSIGVPNACNGCHTEKSAQWAADQLKNKYGEPKPHYGEAIHAGREGKPGASKQLAKLILDDTQPAIARATALTLFVPYLNQQTAQIFQIAGNNPEPMLGYGLANTLDSFPEPRRFPFAYPLLFDDMRITRALAARSLSGIPLKGADQKGLSLFKSELESYRAIQMFNADRPEALLNLAAMALQNGSNEEAEGYLKSALELAPYYVPIYINYADFYRSTGKESKGEAILKQGLNRVTDKTALQFALGLLLVRQKRMDQARRNLRIAAESETASPRYIYVYAIALNSSGDAKTALAVLEKAHRKFETSREILSGLVTINNESGNKERAKEYEEKLRLLAN